MLQKYHVVIVEDDALQFKIIKGFLENLPVELSYAATGNEAIALLTEEEPDLLILDITLPDMRGWDVLDRVVVKEERLKETPILVLTAHTEPPHRVIAALKEINVFMNKPIDSTKFRQTVSSLLGIEEVQT